MSRYLLGSEEAYGTPPATFSASFPGAYLSHFRPKILFILSPTHIAAPPAKALTNYIASGVPFVAPAPISFKRPMLTRASAATRVNEQGLIEVVSADIPRFHHDLVTLAPKGVFIEAAATNFIQRSNGFTAWTMIGVTFITLTDFPIFASDFVWLTTTDGTPRSKKIRRNFASNLTLRTVSVYLVWQV
jgi:hypothetical protein